MNGKVTKRDWWRWLIVAFGAITCGTMAQCTPARAADGALRIDLDGVSLELVLVKAGTFQQGSPEDEPGRNADESPRRKVTISRDFYIGKYPVTRGQFGQFVAETAFRTEAEIGTNGGFGLDNGKLVQAKRFTWRSPGFRQDDDHPVTMVTYTDAQRFAAWLSKKSGRDFVLPSEAEWEFACRAGAETAYYGGRSPDDAAAIGWFKSNAGDGTRAVGQKKANAWGVYDTAGNVYEWCADWYAPYAAGDATDPLQKQSNLSDKPRRVLRGGSFLKEPRTGRSAARYRNDPGSRNADNGFRVLTRTTNVAAADDAEKPTDRPHDPVRPPTSPVDESSRERPTTAPPAEGHEGGAGPVGADGDWNRLEEKRGPRSQATDDGANWLMIAVIAACILGGGGLFVIWLLRKSRGAAETDDFVAMATRGAPSRAEQPSSRQGDEIPPVVTGGRPVEATLAQAPTFGATAGYESLVTQPRVVVDGFWVDGLTIAGIAIAYRYLVDSRPNEGRFVTEPGQTSKFIYTGGTPSQIVILPEALDQTGTTISEGQLLPDRDRTVISDTSTDEILMLDRMQHRRDRDEPPSQTFTGFPSAY